MHCIVCVPIFFNSSTNRRKYTITIYYYILLLLSNFFKHIIKILQTHYQTSPNFFFSFVNSIIISKLKCQNMVYLGGGCDSVYRPREIWRRNLLFTGKCIDRIKIIGALAIRIRKVIPNAVLSNKYLSNHDL